MSEPITTPEVKEQEPIIEFDYQTLHNSSFQQLAVDAKKQVEKEMEEKPEEKVEEKTPIVEELEAKKEEITEKRKEEKKEKLEERVARATIQALQEIKDKEVEEKHKEIEKQALEEKKTYIPKWKSENRVPATWEELHSEAVNEALAKFEVREVEKQVEQQNKLRDEQEESQRVQKAQEERNQQMESQIESEVNDLLSNGKLPTIKDPNNPNDEGVIAKRSLFEAGVRVNNERIAKGLPPISSIKIIYYEHYKKDSQPAGVNAPIAGNSPVTPVNDESFSYADLHNKSYREILADAYRRATGK